MTITKGQGQSDMTPFKQQDLQEFLGLWFTLARNALRNKKFKRTLLYIDTNAGSGHNSEYDCPGSPLIFCEQAEREGVPYLAYLIEKGREACQELSYRLRGYNAHIRCGDNKKLLPSLLNELPPYPTIGLMYIDPNGIPDWDLINQVSAHPIMQSIDILIRYNTGAVWRNHHNGYHLDKDLQNLQKRYLWGKDYYKFDPWHWSFLLGMNFEFGDWQKRGWYRFDTPAGQALKERLSDGPGQRQKKSQFPLTGLIESTCNIPNLELSERKSLKEQVESVKGAISARLRKFIT